MIGIINYGMGNLASVQNALDYLKLANRVVSNPREISNCDRVILPGVGAYGEAMHKINSTGFMDELRDFALVQQRPTLGICLGMQLLLDSSVEHGFFQGLGIVNGEVKYLGDRIKNLPIPHIGWNDVSVAEDSSLLEGIETANRNFYFVHNYYCQLHERSAVIGQTMYGFEIDTLFEYDNIFGVQFHPEKSQKSGLALLQNFGKL